MWMSVPLSFIAWSENLQHAQLYGWLPKDIKNLGEKKTTLYTEVKSLQIGTPKIKNHSWNINLNTWTCIQSLNQRLLFNTSLQNYRQWKAAANSQWHLATALPSLGNWDWFSTDTSVKTFCLGAYNDTKVIGFERQQLLQGWTSAMWWLLRPINVSHFTPWSHLQFQNRLSKVVPANSWGQFSKVNYQTQKSLAGDNT